jgi:hypothetical protein
MMPLLVSSDKNGGNTPPAAVTICRKKIHRIVTQWHGKYGHALLSFAVEKGALYYLQWALYLGMVTSIGREI